MGRTGLLYGGDKEIRTLDPLRARQVLSQLSYIPIIYVIFHLRFYSFIDELMFSLAQFLRHLFHKCIPTYIDSLSSSC